jgi:hypothetical protein
MFKTTAKLKKLGLMLSGVFSAVLFLAPAVSYAQVNTHNLCTGANLTFKDQGCNQNPDGSDVAATDTAVSRAGQIINDVINFVSILVGVAAVIMIIYAGFRLVTSGGSAESTKSAKDTILYAIIGLVVVVFAQVIVKFVLVKISGVQET